MFKLEHGADDAVKSKGAAPALEHMERIQDRMWDDFRRQQTTQGPVQGERDSGTGSEWGRQRDSGTGEGCRDPWRLAQDG